MRSRPSAILLAMTLSSTASLGQTGADTAPTATGPFGSLSSATALPGPFPPRPDNEPSIHRDPKPKAAAQPSTAQGTNGAGTNAAPAPASPGAQPVPEPAVRKPPALELAQWAEEQLDRAELDNERNRARTLQTAAPIAGFTGLTSDRDR